MGDRKITENKHTTKKKSIRSILLPIFVIGFIVCLVIVVKDKLTQKKAEDAYEDMQSSVTEEVTTETGTIEAVADTADTTEVTTEEVKVDKLAELGIEIPEKNLDWDALHAENDDIYAWIYIPDTNIDYPILQHKTEQDFYLDHNVDGSAGYPGCIYTQLYNSKDFTDFTTMIYGHDMLNGTMFQNLHNYEDSKFFAEHPYIYIYTPEKTFVYQVFAAVTFHGFNVLLSYDMNETHGRAAYINDIRDCHAMSDQYDDSITVNTESHIVSLSTCIGSKPNNRWIVSGVLLNE